MGTVPFIQKKGTVPFIYYILSVGSLLLISWAIHAFGETNLPPLKSQVRWLILALYANLGVAYILLIQSHSVNSENLKRWSWVALVGMALCAMHPVFSGDLMEYLIRGRMLAIYHVSPYCAVPTDFPNDILRPYSVWLTNPDSYGPLSVYLQTLPTLIVQQSVKGMVWLYKFMVLGFFALGVKFFWDMLNDLSLPNARKLWTVFAYSPFVIVGALIDGHNDIMMMTFSIISVSFMFQKKYSRAFLFWTCGFLVKYMVILILPFIVLVALKDQWKKIGRFPWVFAVRESLTNIALIILFFAPIWGGSNTFLAIWKQRGAFYTNSFPYAVQKGLGLIGIDAGDNIIRVIFLVCFVAIYGLLMVRCFRNGTDRPVEFFRTLALTFIMFYLVMPSPFGYWYLYWAFPCLVLSGFKRNFLVVVLYFAVGLLACYKRINYMVVTAAGIYITVSVFPFVRTVYERTLKR